MGSVLGFLCFNFPPASIFMGDGGSMILGFILSVLTIRTTYYETGRPWYTVLMPLFVMAIPLYDFVIVSALRLAKGRSPMHGDTNRTSPTASPATASPNATPSWSSTPSPSPPASPPRCSPAWMMSAPSSWPSNC